MIYIFFNEGSSEESEEKDSDTDTDSESESDDNAENQGIFKKYIIHFFSFIYLAMKKKLWNQELLLTSMKFVFEKLKNPNT